MRNRTKEMIMTAMFIAIVFIATYIRIYIPIGLGTGGLMHIGTFAMFAIALKYGKRYGALSGGIGMALFDIASEWAIWAPGTLIVRLLAGYVVGRFSESKAGQGQVMAKNIVAIALGGIVIITGYFLYEAFALGIGLVAISSAVGNLVQIIIGAFALFILPSLPELEMDLENAEM